MLKRLFEFHGVGLLSLGLASAAPSDYCRLEVVEKGTGWPVSLVELQTTHHQRFVTDNAGLIALNEKELMGRPVWFTVQGHGYDAPKDGFGIRGVRVTPEAGKTVRIELERSVIAKRLGRLTGAGIFAESQMLSLEPQWQETGVFGCDSVLNTHFQGKHFWLWGDTTLPGYPLGIFDSTAATTAKQPLAAFEPPVRLVFDHFRNEKLAPRGVAPIAGDGPTWLTGMIALKDASGKEKLVSSYTKIKGSLETYRTGLAVWNVDKMIFESVRELWTQSKEKEKYPPMPEGHGCIHQGYVYFGNPLPTLRFPVSYEAWLDPTKWEILKSQEKVSVKQSASQKQMEVKPHTGSIAWNSFRKCWVTVFMEHFGKPSAFGELWYAESPAPEGPWANAVKILSHDNYTFYNPRLHPEFTPEGSPILLFEGTYTMQFADKPFPTARYDYNQILYRLDLDDPRLH